MQKAKLTAILLCVLMLASFLCSCKGTEGGVVSPDQTEGDSLQTGQPVETSAGANAGSDGLVPSEETELTYL
jgi:hypothetical protein